MGNNISLNTNFVAHLNKFRNISLRNREVRILKDFGWFQPKQAGPVTEHTSMITCRFLNFNCQNKTFECAPFKTNRC